MVKRLCISLSDEDAIWLEENKQSPSKIIQSEIKRIKEVTQTAAQEIKGLQQDLIKRENAILNLNKYIYELQDQLEKKNVLEQKTAN